MDSQLQKLLSVSVIVHTEASGNLIADFQLKYQNAVSVFVFGDK